MKNACRRCRSFQGFCMDDGCCWKTVVRTGIFSHSLSVMRALPCIFLRTWACFGVRYIATPVVEIWRPQNLVFLKDLGGDVEGRLLESSVQSPSRLAPGSSRVISPSAKFYSSLTTSCTAKLPPYQRRIWPRFKYRRWLGHVLQGNHAGVHGGLFGKARRS